VTDDILGPGRRQLRLSVPRAIPYSVGRCQPGRQPHRLHRDHRDDEYNWTNEEFAVDFADSATNEGIVRLPPRCSVLSPELRRQRKANGLRRPLRCWGPVPPARCQTQL
jgi:hypothetical protein